MNMSVECQKKVNNNLRKWRECSSGRKLRMKKTIDNFCGSKMVRHMLNEGILVSMINKKGLSTFW